MNSIDKNSVAAPFSVSVLSMWEHAVIILVFLLAVFGLAGFPYAGGTTWSEVWEFTLAGVFPIAGFGLPVIYFVGSLLLLFRRKSSMIWLGVHIPLSIAFFLSYIGIDSINALFLLGCCYEILVVCFCLRLWSRGALK